MDSAEAWKLKGDGCMAQGQWGEAEQAFRQALALRPDNVDTLAQLDDFDQHPVVARRCVRRVKTHTKE